MTEYIYLIRGHSTDLYKIGRTQQISKRLQNLSVGSPVSLHVVYTRETSNAVIAERKLHQYFSAQHHHGEWHQFNERELDWVKEKIDEYCGVL